MTTNGYNSFNTYSEISCLRESSGTGYTHATSDREVNVADDKPTKTTTYAGPSNQYSLNLNLQKILVTVTKTGPNVSESMKGQLASYVRAVQ